MTELLKTYDTITLDDMKDIRLMNRIDTKFVTTAPVLRRLLMMASEDYLVQDTNSQLMAPYFTVYFDTADCAMYHRHQTGHLERQKLRIRSYMGSGLNFLEVKTKNNHGRTRKKRMVVEDFTPDETTAFDVQSPLYDDFLRSYLQYDPATLTLQLENRFDRITLVNKAKTERLTIDTNLRFHNITTGRNRFMTDIVIIELKRDGHQPSPILPRLLDLRIHQQGFSKYCIGSALTNDTLSRNRFKPRLHSIDKLLNNK